jgi:hypothetical protein
MEYLFRERNVFDSLASINYLPGKRNVFNSNYAFPLRNAMFLAAIMPPDWKRNAISNNYATQCF